ncbi:aminoglycoside phosphotransferase family protein [Phytomonospora sp. NPDC050363]|uniref:phosphotransferase enzyme family protein n=1 Tax=Phytomonospora sp. NPDC050363 TaxID=3155642 RepID=UPI0033E32093
MEFSAASTAATARRAATIYGLTDPDPQLVRLGENAVWRFGGERIIARIARSPQRMAGARREMAIAAWLAGEGIPVVRPAPGMPGPLTVDGLPVTLWVEVPDPSPSTPEQLGQALRALHRLTAPDHLRLEQVEPLHGVDARLHAAPLDDGDRDFLLGLAKRLAAAYTETDFALPVGVVHGDAHVDNLVYGSDGTLAFVDLEDFALCHPEWDLVLTAIERDCGWITGEAYDQFAAVYGYDVTAGPGYEVLRSIRLLRMTSWLAQMAGESERAAAEVAHRVETLRQASPDVSDWNAF